MHSTTNLSRSNWTKKITNMGLALMLITAQITPFFVFGPSAGATENVKVTICHRANSVTNPYQMIEVDESAVDGVSEGDHYLEHTGPVASSEAVAQELKDNKEDWGDIIPPVSPYHSGLNWTSEGQAIYNNDCEYVVPSETGRIKVNKEVDLGDGAGFVADNPSAYGFKWGIDQEVPARNFGDTSELLVKEDGPYTITENEVQGYEYVGWYDGQDSCEHPDGTSFPEVAIRKDSTRTITLCNEKIDEPEVDFCDSSQRPNGMSIGQWLADNQVDGSDCFEVNPTLSCGSFNLEFSKNLTGYDYEFRYVLGDTMPAAEDWEGDGVLPVNFTEDQNGGSVEITVYVVGPEADYFSGFGLPNIWDGNGRTVEVDTDCAAPQENPYVRVTFICKATFDGLAWTGTENQEVAVNNGDYIFRVRYESSNSDANAPATVPYETTQFTATGNIDKDEVIFETTTSSVAGVKVLTTPTNLYDGTASTNDRQLCEQADEPAEVQVLKFNDENQNGVYDDDEEVLPDWTMTLKGTEYCRYQSADFTVVQLFEVISEQECPEVDRSEVTDVSGIATFSAVEPGEYVVDEILEDGWVQTGIQCDYEDFPRSARDEGSEIFALDYGQTRYCTVGNYQEPEEPATPTPTEPEPSTPQVLGASTDVPAAPVVLAATGQNGFNNFMTSLLLIGLVVKTAYSSKSKLASKS